VKKARPDPPGRAKRPQKGETDPAVARPLQSSLPNWPFPPTLLNYSRPLKTDISDVEDALF
jgi:hypothetical protein